jgi:hypothetical protein
VVQEFSAASIASRQIDAKIASQMKNFLILSLALVLFAMVSCNRSPSSATEKEGTAATENSSATISASPNPVPAGPKLGTTTITWDTGGGDGQVYVIEEGTEKLMASGRQGSQTIDWIKPHVKYEFRLYKGSEHKDVLAKVHVTH